MRRSQPEFLLVALTVAFETQIDKSRPLNLKIDQVDKYIILTWERGVLQSSNNIGKDNWSDVLLFNIDGQFATSPHRVKKTEALYFSDLKKIKIIAFFFVQHQRTSKEFFQYLLSRRMNQ